MFLLVPSVLYEKKVPEDQTVMQPLCCRNTHVVTSSHFYAFVCSVITTGFFCSVMKNYSRVGGFDGNININKDKDILMFCRLIRWVDFFVQEVFYQH